MSIEDGWVDWAQVRKGPANKVYPQVNAQEGLVLHSMEGWLAGSWAELAKPERQASWTFSLSQTGILYQHYPVTASCWASGNMVANTLYSSLELEGLAAQPINEAQIATLRKLVVELDYRRDELHEHRNVWNMALPNAGPTACPSERYAPFYAALEEENMADPRLDEVIEALGGIEAIRTWNKTGNSLLVGYALEQLKLGDHLAMPHPLPTLHLTSVPKHAHHTTITHSTTGDVVV